MLILAEKPSVAAAFASALACSKTHGYYTSADASTVITNCIGHLFQLVPPDFYNPAFKKWDMKDLPILPDPFIYEKSPSTAQQAGLVISLLKKHANDTIVIATDAGREGELIARIALQMAGISDISRCRRFWVSEALTPQIIKTGLAQAKPLSHFDGIAAQGYARQRADWLIGMNLSRYMSIGQRTVFPIGRVQTPLAMAVLARDESIKNFKSAPYITYAARITDKAGNAISAQLLNKDDNSVMFPIGNRLDPKLFTGVKITSAGKNTQRKTVPPPQLFNITGLQKEASRRFDYTPVKTLEIAQTLYEKHKCLSYPRTPSRVMGDNNVALVKEVYGMLSQIYPGLAADCNTSHISGDNKRLFNSSQLEDHHALIPLKDIPSSASQDEKDIYNLVLHSFFTVIKDAYVYDLHQLAFHCNGYSFTASLRTVISSGWKAAANGTDTDDDTPDDLQDIKGFDHGNCTVTNFEAQRKKTTPAKHYTMASLLAFMEHPKETGKLNLCGLGTPATRAEIIKDLIAHGYLAVSAKKITATDKTKFLFNRLSRMPLIHPFASVSKTTGMEQQLKENPQKFEQDIISLLKTALVPLESVEQFEASSVGNCPLCSKPLRENSKSWYCSAYKSDNCSFTVWKHSFGTQFTADDLKLLLAGETTKTKPCTSKNGNKFSARFKLAGGSLEPVFEKLPEKHSS